jgi:hypothetical protein
LSETRCFNQLCISARRQRGANGGSDTVADYGCSADCPFDGIFGATRFIINRQCGDARIANQRNRVWHFDWQAFMISSGVPPEAGNRINCLIGDEVPVPRGIDYLP